MRRLALFLLAAAAGTGLLSGGAQAAEAEAGDPQKHTVAAGESLSAIAQSYKQESWRPIWNANPELNNPDVISVGQILVVPQQPVQERPLPAGYGEVAPSAPAAVHVAPRTAQGYKTYQSAPRPKASPAASGDLFNRIRVRESGNNYQANTGNGYYGAYQYDMATWNNYGGYARADLAPPGVQDAKAQDTFARRGCSPWPNTCF